MAVTVSVIIPARNRPLFTSQAIQSVLNQNLPPNTKLEIVVIDAYSNPELKKIIGKDFPEVEFIKSRGYNSPGGTRNFGLKQITGDYIAFLDNDDQWKSDFIKSSLKAINKNKGPATVCFTSHFFHGSYPATEKFKLFTLNLVKHTIFTFYYVFNNRKLPQSGFYLCQISHMLFNRQSIQKIRFNHHAIAAEDWEFIADISHKKCITILPKKLVNFRYTLNSNTNIQEVKKKKWQAYQDLLQKLPSTHTQGILNILFHLYIKVYS